jgi:hypothetical protein
LVVVDAWPLDYNPSASGTWDGPSVRGKSWNDERIAVKKIALALVLMGAGWMLRSLFDGAPPRAEAGVGLGGGEEKCAEKNGDVNASGVVDLSDAVTILGNLFLGYPTELLPLCTSSATRGLPATGQTQCTDCTGGPRPCGGFTEDFLTFQDGFLRTGCPNDSNRFTDNGDGTVTDNCTGLMWQKDTADINGGDIVNTWCGALAFCMNLSFAGHDDWRLPNVTELLSIVDYGRFDQAIDPVFGALSAFYWSSTSDAGFPDDALVVGFGDGKSVRGGKENGGRVRAVRGP